MRQVAPTMALIMTGLTLAVCQTGMAKSHTLPIWKSEPSLASKLAPTVKEAGFTISPPRGYVLKATHYPDAVQTISQYRWHGPAHPSHVTPFFGVDVITPRQAISHLDPKSAITLYLKNLRQHGGFVVSPISEGKINQAVFARAFYYLKATGQQKHPWRGFVYLTVTRTSILSVSCTDEAAYYKESGLLGEAAALTIKLSVPHTKP